MLRIRVMLVLVAAVVCVTERCGVRFHVGLAKHRRRPGLRWAGHDENTEQQTRETSHQATLPHPGG